MCTPTFPHSLLVQTVGIQMCDIEAILIVPRSMNSCEAKEGEREVSTPRGGVFEGIFSTLLIKNDIFRDMTLVVLDIPLFPGLIWFGPVYLVTTAGFVADRLM